MTIGAKHMDPIVGVDTHIVMIPSPAGPIPTPLPNPYVGMVMDPFDYAPIIGGTVYINGMMRGQAGTGGIAIVPHMPLGGPLVPPPTNESEIFMGSATVASDGDAQSYLGLMVLSCQSVGMPPPPRAKGAPPKSLVLPTSTVLSVPMGPPVLIGGPPTISLMALGFRAGFAALGKLGGMIRKAQRGPGRFGDAMRAITRKANNAGDALADALKLGAKGRQRIKNAVCTVTGHPVDVATGRVFTEKTDLELPGPIPFVWKRSWSSTSTYQGELGHGWHHSYQHALYVQKDVVLYRDNEGRAVSFPPLNEGQEYFSRRERLTLIRDAHGYALRSIDRLVYRFRSVGRPNGEHVLASIQDPVGNAVQLLYDERGLLAEIIDSCARRLQLTHDREGRIAALIAPHPDVESQRVYVAQYSYDQSGNLVQVLDALNQPARYQYVGHLLVQEADRNGLSFYFAYDGHDENAKCVRTWGDGGIYDHKLLYEVDTGVTWVENSLGYTTKYLHKGGQVVEVVDARGGMTLTEYNEYGQKVKETNPLGAISQNEYDERGNAIKTTAPDGGVTKLEYDTGDLLIRAIDAVGGEWHWEYDDAGKLVARIDPLGRRTLYVWAGKRLATIIDPAQHRMAFGYDGMGNLESFTFRDGSTLRWSHDGWGRIREAIDVNGNVESREHDFLNRIFRAAEHDGNVNTFMYDPESNVVQTRDKHGEVQFQYGGFGKLVARTEAGTRVEFIYDTEEQLIAIRNEHGSIYRFEYGPTGALMLETGFDGVTKRYERDLAGRITVVERSGGVKAAYAYDAADRLVKVEYSDGTHQAYRYRADGELIQAANDTISVTLELDLVGNILKETQGANWVASEYDPLDQRVRVRSSKGLDLKLSLNANGDYVSLRVHRAGADSVRAADEAPDALLELAFERDKLGLELERKLPGGVRVRWERDRLGRPVKHEVWSKGTFRSTRQLTWDVDERLTMIIDALTGPVRYSHDSFGHLAAAFYPEGHVDLRMPDSLGRLFRTNTRTDRTYGPAGQLLENRGPNGTTRYEYDFDGNLVRKVEPDGGFWTYEWSVAGMLSRVVRPDGDVVEFGYDALSRRVWKKFRGKTTRWMWDGNAPLHEWLEHEKGNQSTPIQPSESTDAATAARRAQSLSPRTAQGPPSAVPPGTENDPLTWLIDPKTLTPLGKIAGGRPHGIVVDHLGTPTAMFDDAGEPVWSAELDVYGAVRRIEGARENCPFRWPGHYEDAETGLYYNRLRYYDPESGEYVSQDPLRTEATLEMYTYVPDPNVSTDMFGLGDPIHHIATNKNPLSEASGGPWTPRFKRIFDAAGVDLDDPMNKVEIPGHKGPHPQEYHEKIYERLREATKGKKTKAARKRALAAELGKLKRELRDRRTRLNALVTKRVCS